jgi:hypothetical protein
MEKRAVLLKRTSGNIHNTLDTYRHPQKNSADRFCRRASEKKPLGGPGIYGSHGCVCLF